MPTTIPLKRPPARAGPLPVQTGFPTSLADIVVKNHGRLRNPRRRHRAPGAAVPPPTAAAEPQQRRELSAAQVPAPVPARPAKGAGFSIRPGLLVAGGAVALALLVIWSKQLVAAATVASVALSCIEYARTVRDRRRPERKEAVDSRRGRGCVSPIREAAESPMPSCGECGCDDGGSDAASLWSADVNDLGGDDSSSSANNPKRKQSRRSLRKLLANKLRNGKTPRGTHSRHGGEAGEHERPETPGRLSAEYAPSPPAAAPAEQMPALAPPSEAIADDDRCGRRRGRALPLPEMVPIILAGLVAGKLPALALAVLCAAFSSSSVERVPAGQANR